MNLDIKKILSNPLHDNLGVASLPELRDVRDRCDSAESDISFVRRVAQGRLDIVGHEVRRRVSDEAEVKSEEIDASNLLFDLPDILSDQMVSPKGKGRAVGVMEPGPVALSLSSELDALVSPSALAGVEGLDQESLANTFEGLRSFEADLSTSRSQLHKRIDLIQEEIARRYRDGEVSVETLLK